MLNGNIFKEAKELLREDKPISEMTEEEVLTIKAAMIPLNLPEFQDSTIDQGLEELANILDRKEEL